MTIDQIVALAQRIHDAEGYNLGSSSTRDYRNAFWARVIGCVHHGHPVYNETPDRAWHLKKASSTSPQSDDVTVMLPSKLFWDCIPGAGADGYHFEAHGPETLPIPPQIAYAPPVPAGTAPPVQPPQPPTPSFPYPDEPSQVRVYQDRVKAAYKSVGRIFPDPNDSDAFRHFSRYGYDCSKMVEQESADKHIKELRGELGAPPE